MRSHAAIIPIFVLRSGIAEALPLDGGTSIDCAQFARKEWPSMPCLEYTEGGYPKEISGAKVDIYRYTEGWVSTEPTGMQHLADISTVAGEVLPFYSTLSPPFELKIMLMLALLPNRLGEEESKPGDHTSCFVRVLNPRDNNAEASFQVKHTTAHELYHCVQERNEPTDIPDNDATRWWIEGSAEYFANRFYPDLSPNAHIKQYDPSNPLYTHAYNASLFFQFLSNIGWSDERINDFVSQQPATTDPLEERKRLANNVELRNVFPRFVQHYKDRTITFRDGTPAQADPGNKIETRDITAHLTADGQRSIPTIGVAPFAMKMYTAVLEPGQNFVLAWEPTDQNPQTLLYYRKTGDTFWIPFRTPTLDIRVGCGDGATEYQFLLTSTADLDLATGKLSFERESSQSCECNDLGIPIDPCLSGNWNLNLDDLRDFLAAKMAESSGVTITNLSVSGAATFEMPLGDMSAMTFDHTHITYSASAFGENFATDINLSGSLTAKVVMQAPGEFCWKDGQVQGEADTTTTVEGLGDPIVFNVPLGTDYGMPWTRIKYACTANTLQIGGYDGEALKWAYSFTKI